MITMNDIMKRVTLTAVIAAAVVAYAYGKDLSIGSKGLDSGLPTTTWIDAGAVWVAGDAGVVVPVVEKEGVRFGGPACIPGTGTGQAQDATAQCIAAKYGLGVPVGGTGTGLCQDATLQAILGAIPADGGSVVTFPLHVTNPTNIIQDDTSGQSILQTISDILIINGSEGTLFLNANNAAIVSVDTAGMFPVVNNAYTLGLSGDAWSQFFVGTVPGGGGINSLWVNDTTVNVGGLVGGVNSTAFAFNSSTAIDVSVCGGDASPNDVVLSPAQIVTPVIPLTGTLGANCTITLPNRPGAVWEFGFAGVTFSSHSVIFSTGTGTSATITALKAGGYTLVTVTITSSNVVEAG